MKTKKQYCFWVDNAYEYGIAVWGSVSRETDGPYSFREAKKRLIESLVDASVEFKEAANDARAIKLKSVG